MSFAKSPARAGFPRHGPSPRGSVSTCAVSAGHHASARGLCRACGRRGLRVWAAREIHFFSKELEMVS